MCMLTSCFVESTSMTSFVSVVTEGSVSSSAVSSGISSSSSPANNSSSAISETSSLTGANTGGSIFNARVGEGDFVFDLEDRLVRDGVSGVITASLFAAAALSVIWGIKAGPPEDSKLIIVAKWVWKKVVY